MLVVFSKTTSAQSAHSFGLGVMLGAPTGVSVNCLLTKSHAIDFALAWQDGGQDLHLHGDYLWYPFSHFKLDNVKIDVYSGIGGRVLIEDDDNTRDNEDDFHFGPRAPIGVRYLFLRPRLEIFLEAAFIFDLVPDTDFDIDGALGARYYF